MTKNDELYVPSEDEMRYGYRLTRMLDHYADVDAAFDRFIARVKRDAWAECARAMGASTEWIDRENPHGTKD